MATMSLQAAKRAIQTDQAKALASLIEAESKFKELARSNVPDSAKKKDLAAAKTKTTLARKELEAAKSDSKSDHITKAATLVDEALERVKK